jgi:hypothetical protein
MGFESHWYEQEKAIGMSRNCQAVCGTIDQESIEKDG